MSDFTNLIVNAASKLVPSAAGFVSAAGPMAEASTAPVIGPIAAPSGEASAPASAGAPGRDVVQQYNSDSAAMRRRLKQAPRALRRFDELVAAAKVASTAVRSFDDDLRDAEKELQTAKINLAENRGEVGGWQKSSAGAARAQARLDEAKELITNINARREPLIERQRAMAHTRQAVTDYLVFESGALADAPAVKISKSATVESLTAKVADLRLDLEAVHAAPYPATETKQRIARELDAIAEHGRVSALNAVEHGSQLQWPARSYTTSGFGAERDSYDRHELAPAMLAFVWLHRDALEKRLHEDIDALAKASGKAALSATERRDKAETIKADILSTERHLAEVVWSAGDLARFPEGLDPRAVLGITGPAPRAD